MARIILLVEDDRTLREALAEGFSCDGHTVHQAGHGAEALKLLADGCRPGIILLDILMPVMDGIRFLELKNKDALLAHIPVIVISATEREALAGVAQLLSKPLDFAELETAIGRHYAPPSPRDQTATGG